MAFNTVPLNAKYIVPISSIGDGNHVYGVCEFLGPTGSIKDRVIANHLKKPETSAIITKETTIIIPSTGNLAIAFAFYFNNKCSRIIALLPEHVTPDKTRLLRYFGAEIIRANWHAHPSSPDSIQGIARKLANDIKDSIIIDENDYIIDDSYVQMSKDMIESIGTSIDYIVLPMESSCLVNSVYEYLTGNNMHKKVKLIVACSESSFAGNHQGHPSKTEGLYCPHKPEGLNEAAITTIHQVSDVAAYTYTQMLIEKEKLLVGSSSGACVYVASKLHDKDPKAKIAVLFEDSAMLYPNTVLNVDWLIEHQLIKHHKSKRVTRMPQYVVADLDLAPVSSIDKCSQIRDALDRMVEREFDQLPVIDSERKLVGFITFGHLELLMKERKAQLEDEVGRWMFSWQRRKGSYVKITMNTRLSDLAEFFEKNSVAFVTDEDGKWILGVCTKYDLIKFFERLSLGKDTGGIF